MLIGQRLLSDCVKSSSVLCPALRRNRPAPTLAWFPFPSRTRHFFGRAGEIAELRRRLRHQNYLFVIGPSGSGKSSLVFAGLIPELQRQQPGEWVVKTMRPGYAPLEGLAQVFDGVVEPETGYGEHVAALLAQAPDTQRLLIVIDQFEELFAQTPKPDQAAFIAVITALRQVPNCALPRRHAANRQRWRARGVSDRPARRPAGPALAARHDHRRPAQALRRAPARGR